MRDVDDECLLLPAWRQRQMLDAGEISSAALTRGYLDRIARLNGKLAGFGCVDAEAAMAQAEAADRRLGAGERTPILGLSFGVKDIIETADLPTSYGSRAFAAHRPGRDATAVARIRRQGGVILGKANTHEFATWSPSPLFGLALNPWDAGRIAGGSSNGSAVSASASLCAIAIGTDTAGSIRNPASYCGVFGLKTTHGRVSTEGVGVLASSMDTVGPMARSAADCALALQVLAGHDPADPISAEAMVDDYIAASQQSAEGMVAGIPQDWYPDAVAPELRTWLQELTKQLRASGVTVIPISGALPPFDVVHDIWMRLCAGEALAWHRRSPPAARAQYGAMTNDFLNQMEAYSAADAAAARIERHALRRSILTAMRGADVLLLPATPTAACTFGEIGENAIHCGDRTLPREEGTICFTLPFSVTGLPAITVPVGLNDAGMPLSVQLAGPGFQEAALLRMAALIEKCAALNANPRCAG